MAEAAAEQLNGNSNGAEAMDELESEEVEARPTKSLPSDRVLEQERQERIEEEERKRARDPPIVFKDMEVNLYLISMFSTSFIIIKLEMSLWFANQWGSYNRSRTSHKLHPIANARV